MRRYIKSNYHIRAMISRVKYYRRRKAEYLKQRRKVKNYNYYLYTYNFLLRKYYSRFIKLQACLGATLTNNFKNSKLSQNTVKLFSKKRRHEVDDFYEDEEINKKHHSEGLYYTNNRMTEIGKNFISTNSLLDSLYWRNYRIFYNSTKANTNRSVLGAYNVRRITTLSKIIRGPMIRINYAKLYRMDRLKFPIVNYNFKNKLIKTFLKYNYIFRKMSGFLAKKITWKKVFSKNTLWKNTRIFKTKILNKMKIIIHKTYNNFYITALDKNQQVIVGYSAGCSGLLGSKRLSPVSAEKVAKKFINKFFDKVSYFANVDIYIKSKRIDAAIRNILNILIRTKKIHYSKIFKRRILIQIIVHKLLLATTPAHNGVRQKHQRRV